MSYRDSVKKLGHVSNECENSTYSHPDSYLEPQANSGKANDHNGTTFATKFAAHYYTPKLFPDNPFISLIQNFEKRVKFSSSNSILAWDPQFFSTDGANINRSKGIQCETPMVV